MPFLVAVVVLLAALCLVDLVLTVGVIKRLREHTELITTIGAAGGGRPPVIGVGEEVADFEASTVDGEALNRAALSGETLVGFFATNCQPCREKLPQFVAFARALPRERVLAAVTGDPEAAAEFVADLSPVARVVVEDGKGPLGAAFKVTATPSLLRVAPDRTGRLVVKDNRVDLTASAVAA